jgi:hexosaminidase
MINPMKASLLLLATLLGSAPLRAAERPGPALIPVPQKLELRAGNFRLTAQTRLVTDAAGAEAGELLRQRLNVATGFAVKLEAGTPDKAATPGAILLTTNGAKATLGAEGYELNVTPEAVVIRAAQPAGLFYGTQTLLQLLPPDIFATNAVTRTGWPMPCVQIEDAPRFAWRGLMLDVSRHFQGKEFIKRYLDAMALHKLNVFHWHLTDDQGWRIEIKKYPKLTSVGAWRQQPGYSEQNGPYGGFYTQDDIREVVAYAAARHITIVPEIDIPGHSQAALAAYPELSCSGAPGFVGYFNEFPALPRTKWPSNSCNVFCASNPKTYTFFQDVLTETMSLFPGQYIHIGGDEVGTNYWTHCAQCQALMASNGLKNTHELQAWLTGNVARFLSDHHRRLIGWDEILQGGLPANATVMSWRGITGGIAAVKAGHAAVMSPAQSLYFNRAQSNTPDEPPAPPRPLITVETVYKYEPVPAGLTPAQEKLILGAEACIWTERLHRSDWLETMSYPRLCALAEVDWSPKTARNWEQFSQRIQTHLRRLELLGVNYSRVEIAPAKEAKLADASPAEKRAPANGQ